MPLLPEEKDKPLVETEPIKSGIIFDRTWKSGRSAFNSLFPSRPFPLHILFILYPFTAEPVPEKYGRILFAALFTQRGDQILMLRGPKSVVSS